MTDRTCAGPCALKGSHIEGDCEGYVPMSHYEKIRSMSIEEMAEFLTRYVWNEDDAEGDFLSHLVADTLDWLNLEVKEAE